MYCIVMFWCMLSNDLIQWLNFLLALNGFVVWITHAPPEYLSLCAIFGWMFVVGEWMIDNDSVIAEYKAAEWEWQALHKWSRAVELFGYYCTGIWNTFFNICRYFNICSIHDINVITFSFESADCMLKQNLPEMYYFNLVCVLLLVHPVLWVFECFLKSFLAHNALMTFLLLSYVLILSL